MMSNTGTGLGSEMLQSKTDDVAVWRIWFGIRYVLQIVTSVIIIAIPEVQLRI
jgi:hypothetical protein